MSATRLHSPLDTRTPTGGPVLVGLDPGAVTGVAVWSPALGQLLHVGSGTFWAVRDLIEQRTDPARGTVRAGRWGVAGVVVEDPRALPIYARHRSRAGGGPVGRGEADRIARSVGRIDRDVDLWETWLRDAGFGVHLSAPQRRRKWDAAALARMSGWTAPTNEHGRDAARLVVGRSASSAQAWTSRGPEAGDAP